MLHYCINVTIELAYETMVALLIYVHCCTGLCIVVQDAPYRNVAVLVGYLCTVLFKYECQVWFVFGSHHNLAPIHSMTLTVTALPICL
jgi:hypothetical protein